MSISLMTTQWAEHQRQPTTVSAVAHRRVRTSLATAALMIGLAIGLAASASATPEDDFWECVGDHQDTDGIGVCCVFYGGTYDEKSGECWDYPQDAEATEGAPSPKGPMVVRPGLIDSGQVLQPATTTPVLAPVPQEPVAAPA